MSATTPEGAKREQRYVEQRDNILRVLRDAGRPIPRVEIAMYLDCAGLEIADTLRRMFTRGLVTRYVGSRPVVGRGRPPFLYSVGKAAP